MNMPVMMKAVSVPARKYNILVRNATVRRMTIMEWTLLRIINDYAGNPQYSKKTLSDFLEGIMGMSDCEQLLHPCVASLLRMKLITIDNHSRSSLSGRIRLSALHLTDDGVLALKRSYIPGEYSESEETIVHNLLTGCFSPEEFSKTRTYSSLPSNRLTRHDDYDEEFPEMDISQAFNNGSLLGNHYYANKKIVDHISNIENSDVWLDDLITLNTDDGKTYQCNYPLTREVLSCIKKMSPALLEHADLWMDASLDGFVNERPFTANGILNQMENIIDHCGYCIIHADIWDSYRQLFPTNGRKTLFFVAGGNDFRVEDEKLEHVIYLPCSMPIEHALMLSDGKDCLIGGMTEGRLDTSDQTVAVCYAFERKQTINLSEWLLSSIQEKYIEFPEMLSLLSLPIVAKIPSTQSFLREAIHTSFGPNDIVNSLVLLNRYCNALGTDPLDIKQNISDLSSAIDPDDIATAKNGLQRMYSQLLYDYDHDVYMRVIADVAGNHLDTNIVDNLMQLLSAIDTVKKVDLDAFRKYADEICSLRISGTQIDNLFGNFSSGIPKELPEYLTICQIYNKLAKLLRFTEGTLKNFWWHSDISFSAVVQDITDCANLTRLRDCILAIKDILEQLKSIGCNAFNENAVCCVITEKAEQLFEIVNCFVYGDGNPQQVYFIDTCAFINTPDILDYFRADEMVRIPFTVLQELDYHKDNKDNHAASAVKLNAARACKHIEARDLKARENNDPHFALESKDYPELLPAEFSKRHDHLILSAAFRYKLFKPTIITDDTNFRNIIRSQDISTIAWSEFIRQRGGTLGRTSSSDHQKVQEIPVPEPIATTQATDTEDISKEAFLARSIDALKEAPFYVAGKHTKTLHDNGFPTLRALYNTTDLNVKNRFKATSVRKMALQVREKLRNYIQEKYPS